MPAAQSLLSLVKEGCQLKGQLREFFPSPLGMLTCQQDCTSPTPPIHGAHKRQHQGEASFLLILLLPVFSHTLSDCH